MANIANKKSSSRPELSGNLILKPSNRYCVKSGNAPMNIHWWYHI